MNKIINQKRYNTETAKCLGVWNNGHYGNDFNACEEKLYIKKTGEYFLHGKGGAMSKYAAPHGENMGSGEEIIPLSYEAATKWAEKHMNGSEYEAIFGEVEEDTEDGEEKEKITITLPADVVLSLKEKKELNGVNISRQVAKALKDAGY